MFVIKIGAKGISKDILETVNANTNDNNLNEMENSKEYTIYPGKNSTKINKKNQNIKLHIYFLYQFLILLHYI